MCATSSIFGRTTMSMSRSNALKKDNRRSIENPPSRPFLRADTLGWSMPRIPRGFFLRPTFLLDDFIDLNCQV